MRDVCLYVPMAQSEEVALHDIRFPYLPRTKLAIDSCRSLLQMERRHLAQAVGCLSRDRERVRHARGRRACQYGVLVTWSGLKLDRLLHRHQLCRYFALAYAIGTSADAIECCVRLRGQGYSVGIGHQRAKSILQ